MIWKTARREISLEKTLIMAILNVTPDSFSDGGKFLSIDDALRQVDKFVAEGANIIDIGGESSRPNASRVTIAEEISRVVPVITEIKKRFDVPISIDTTKSDVAEKSIEAGAEIVNDISGLRFDPKIAEVAEKYQTGLILMHLRGDFETMHAQTPVDDILKEVSVGFRFSLKTANNHNVQNEQIVLDIGIGFSKTLNQNLELIAKLDKICTEFREYPVLVGASRKSFIGKILGDAPPAKRLIGTLAVHELAVLNGAKILRVHDVRETAESVKIIEALKNYR